MEKNIKNIRKQFRDNWVFYTSSELANKLKQYIDIDISNVYDPTCWQWNLLKVFDDNIKKYGQELDWNELEKCSDIPNFTWYRWDTLLDPAFMDMKFDAIIWNPPFSVKWEQKQDDRFCAWVLPPQSKADYAFMLHMLYLLSEAGVCVTLSAPGILYRWNAEWKIRKWLVDMNYIETIERIPKNMFVDTSIETALLVFRKNKNNTDINFIDWDMSRKVWIDEIIKNDYDLAVNRYLQKEETKESIDPVELQKQAREFFLKTMIAEIEFDKAICKIEWWDHGVFLNMINDVINSRIVYLQK